MVDDIVTRLRAVFHNDKSVELMNREAADEIERLREERDEARRETMQWMAERSSTREMTSEYKKRGWEYLKENTND